MTTATYEGRRVQVLGDSIPMKYYEGKWYPIATPEKEYIVRELDGHPFGDFVASESELSEYEEIETA